jgi:hypothetical protein
MKKCRGKLFDLMEFFAEENKKRLAEILKKRAKTENK